MKEKDVLKTDKAEHAEDSPTDSSDVVNQAEDAVMKVMMEFFSEEMLPFFGITQKAEAFVSTEETRIEIKKSYQDFNFLMADGSIAHFEFQSTNKGIRDLRRFRAYEGNLSYMHQRSVITYVLFSGRIQNPVTQLQDGINSYRIEPLIMSQHNADSILKSLKEKIQRRDVLTREDLILLPLLPTFSGESSQEERIRTAFEFTAMATQVAREDIERIEATIYAMAVKFLNNIELSHIKGAIKMTYLGQLLMEDGREEGRREGRREEQKNTERERLRAEKAEAELRELKKRYGQA